MLTELFANPLILGVILAIVIFLSFKLIKSVLKAVLVVVVVVILLSAIFGINVYQEVKSFKEDFPSKEKAFLYVEDEQVLAGFHIGAFEDEETIFSAEELASFPLQEPPKEYYLTFIISKEAIDNVTVQTKGPFGKDLSNEFLLEVLSQEDPIGYVTQTRTPGYDSLSDEEKVAARTAIEELYGTGQDLKSVVFAGLVKNALEEQGGMFFLDGIREDSITVKPTKIVFSYLKMAGDKTFAIGQSLGERLRGDDDGN
ncbi:MAG: hypothetical protein H6502_03890 [Candidatus Woesearchaeota archaeon]|nr:MAG: hypothetical protein H6502_03890 [Candidatus Woesearchaeota archaeon]